jgi:Spy/CpxP family protein refolding chaperone
MIKQNLVLAAGALALTVSPLAKPSAAQPASPTTPITRPASPTAPLTQPAPTAPVAQPASPTAPATQSASPTGGVGDILKTLNLTPEQQPKVDRVQANAAVKIKSVLNADQLRQLDAISKKGNADSEAFKALNLSPEQKTKLNEVQMGVAQELFAILTPDQQQKLIDQMIARTGKTQQQR